MNALDLILLIIAVAACAGFLLQTKKAQQAVVDVSKATAKAEEDIKAQRERILQDAEKEAARTLDRGQKEADALRKESELKAKEQSIQARQEAETLVNERMANLEKQS